MKEVWRAESPQSAPPLEAHVTNDGRYVVLQDEDSTLPGPGLGIVLAFIDPSGRALKTYRIQDVVNTRERKDMVLSTAGYHWTSGGMLFFRNHETQFVFITGAGAIKVFDLATGEKLPVSQSLANQIRVEQIPAVRKDLLSSDPDTRSRAARNVATLNDRASIAHLILMMDDRYSYRNLRLGSPDPVVKDGEYTFRPVQEAAGHTLVKMLGRWSVPYLAPKLNTKDPNDLDDWLYLIAQAGGPDAVRLLDREVNERKHTYFLSVLLSLDDVNYARAHPGLLTEEKAAPHIYRTLAINAVKADEPLFRKGLNSAEPLVQWWSLKGLIRLNPLDLGDVLRRYLAGPGDKSNKRVAELELVRLGDQNETSKFLKYIAGLANHPGKHQFYCSESWSVQEALKPLLVSRPPALEAALRTALKTECEDVRIDLLGALCVLGDKPAMEYLRQLAARPARKMELFEINGPVDRRASAIDWLGLAKDRESIPVVRAAVTDDESEVQEAAERAIKLLTGSPSNDPNLGDFSP